MSEASLSTSLTPAHEQLVRDFRTSLQVELNDSPHTVRGYCADVRAFLRWCERELRDPLTLHHQQIRLYLAYLDQAQYSRTTINRHLSSLKSFYRFLVVTQVCETSPAEVIQGPKQPRSLPHVMTASDMQRLLSVSVADKKPEEVTACDIRNQALLELLYACGLRVSEASGLVLDGIDFKQALVRVWGKGSKERLVPLHETALEALSRYVTEARDELLAGKSSSFVFVSTRGRQMSTDAIRRVFKAALRQAGLDESFSPHAVRHTFATDLLSGGANLRSVQEMLGHASLSTTQIYTHLSAEYLQQEHSRAHPRG